MTQQFQMFQALPIELTRLIVTFFVCSPEEDTKSVDISTIGTLIQVNKQFYSLCRQRYIWEFYYSTFFPTWKIAKDSKHNNHKIVKGINGRETKENCVHTSCDFGWMGKVGWNELEYISDDGVYNGHLYVGKKHCTNLSCYSGLELKTTKTKFEIDELINKCGVKLYGVQKKFQLTIGERAKLDNSETKIEKLRQQIARLETDRSMLLVKERATQRFNEQFKHVFDHQRNIENKKKLRKQKILAIKEATKLKLKREKAKKNRVMEAKKNALELKQFFRAFQICPQNKTKTVTKPRRKLTDEEKAEREIKRFFKNLNLF
jgi:hypothetical protein